MGTDTPTDVPDKTASPRRRRWRWLVPALLIIAWLGIGAVGGPYQGRLAEVQSNDNASFLPADAESTRVADAQQAFAEEEVLPAVLVYERLGGLTDADRAAIAERVAEIPDVPGVQGEVSPPIPSPDGEAVQVVIPLPPDGGEEIVTTVEALRETVGADLPEGLSAYVTGPAGLVGDFASAFGGIDGLLLGVAAGVVALILLLVYRSPLLPLIVLTSGILALSLAVLIVYQLAANDVLTLNGQSQGILFILVFGAATDYALLLVARFREELRREESKWVAMRRAYRGSIEPIAASAGTVILGLLCLLLSGLNSNRGLGPIAATGIVTSLVASLTFLPAVLVLLGRAAFWPFRPKLGSEGSEVRGIWARVARLVGARPRLVWIVTALVLLAGAAALPQFRAEGVAQSDFFIDKSSVESVQGQEALGRHFPAGTGSPAVIISTAGAEQEVIDAASGVDGVASVARAPGAPEPVNGLVELNAVLADPADSPEAVETVQQLREAVRAVPGADAIVGGQTAAQLDVRETARSDLQVIIPAVLLVVFVILALLLRALVAPLLLIATVVLSFAATLGVAALLFNEVFEFPGGDPSVPLFAFIFLVALGVDYNIFLMSRVREEAKQIGTRAGTLRALAVTGGVITSAGVVLAATFSALAVLPILFLVQIAFLVAFGVLLDTLIVRSLLVPALTLEIGRFVWWPGALRRGKP
ncbi:MAG TPA: MMPL family transporter [Pseudonocardia sp.]|nr:MMPL family transporter [Pseudonocardia sp.]